LYAVAANKQIKYWEWLVCDKCQWLIS